MVALAAACGADDTDSFNADVSVDDVEAALLVAGLPVCDAEEIDWDTGGFVRGSAFNISENCDGDESNLVVVSEWESESARNAAQRNATTFVRHNGHAHTTVLSYGPYLITVDAASDAAGDVIEVVRDLGAV